MSNNLLRFLFTAFFLFAAWFVIYELWLHPAGHFDRIVIENIIFLSSILLRTLEFRLIPEQHPDESMRTIGIDGTHGLWIGDPCNGLTLMALFTGFILAFPGLIKHKLWFLPAGLLSIHLINIIRVCALTIIIYYKYEWLDFNHTYTFTIIVYSWVFFLWYIWANMFSGLRSGQKTRVSKEEPAG